MSTNVYRIQIFGQDDGSRRWAVASMIAPMGALLRFALRKLNARHENCPDILSIQYGTWLANFLAVLISCLLTRLTRTSALDMKLDLFIHGIISGFSGSLSTIATLIHEMHILDQSTFNKTLCVDLYVFITILTGFILAFIIT
eukprot:Protomagalhaensia_sp_Gyna_25__3579@NODE_3214_length_675_cov_4_111635_g2693_i0_p1_GENE_NODE_3214_length_675_cov_4_111635_g2693_i0NODE_3214_length_675_cov_4_111635_g2693_i0_p1_ORF_typecomplete_len143_score14_30CRCB/PF02537_15/4_1e12Xol1_N/PF09108_10/0_043PHO4/PF01384_20/0_059_NODE_3214_length_675_cov_4_111635_g2693_i016444